MRFRRPPALCFVGTMRKFSGENGAPFVQLSYFFMLWAIALGWRPDPEVLRAVPNPDLSAEVLNAAYPDQPGQGRIRGILDDGSGSRGRYGQRGLATLGPATRANAPIVDYLVTGPAEPFRLFADGPRGRRSLLAGRSAEGPGRLTTGANELTALQGGDAARVVLARLVGGPGAQRPRGPPRQRVERTRLANRMREQLCCYYPQFLVAIGEEVAAPRALQL